jgi:hypothetical protein
MLESLFLTINEWMTGATVFAALGCFLWGIVSVLFSPCHLASIPLMVAYVGGQEVSLQPRQAGYYRSRRGDLRFVGPHAWRCRKLLAGPYRAYSHLGGPGDVGGGKMLPFRCFPAPPKSQRSLRGLRPRAGLRCAFRFLHIRFHCPYPRHYNNSAASSDRGSFYHALRRRPLSPHCCGWQFHGSGAGSAGKQSLAGSRRLVQKGGRRSHRPSGRLFYRKPFLYRLNVKIFGGWS